MILVKILSKLCKSHRPYCFYLFEFSNDYVNTFTKLLETSSKYIFRSELCNICLKYLFSVYSKNSGFIFQRKKSWVMHGYLSAVVIIPVCMTAIILRIGVMRRIRNSQVIVMHQFLMIIHSALK